VGNGIPSFVRQCEVDMCGILAIWDPVAGTPELKACVQRGLARLQHRGPDDTGVSVLEDLRLGLGQTRLSIIDLSPLGNQPMFTRDGRWAIICNGEIYNFRQLARDHLSGDRDVNTASDIAVLLAMVRKYWTAAIPMLDGMFSLLVVDRVSNRLLIARDRFGEKPLYWSQRDGRFTVSSELRALNATLRHRPSMSRDGLIAYHLVGSIPAPDTVWEGVHALPAATLAEVDSTHEVRPRTYWHPESDAVPMGVARAGAPSELRQRLEEAVASRQVSDVPVGLFLSGGVDSNAILALAKSANQAPHIALSIDFPEGEFSEFAVAEASAKMAGIPLIRHELCELDFIAGIGGFFDAMDQPTIDGYNTYFLARAAQKTGVKVWLSGVGGDELFGGYPSFRRMPKWRRFAELCGAITPATLPGGLARRIGIPKYSRALLLAMKGDARSRVYQMCRSLNTVWDVDAMLAPGAWATTEEVARVAQRIFRPPPAASDDFTATSLMELGLYMGSQLLRDIDNFGMWFSIEIRAPLLTPALLSAAFRSRSNYSASVRPETKPALIDAIGADLSSAVPRTSKRGFTFPVERWLKQHLMAEMLSALESAAAHDFWPPASIRRIVEAHKSGRIHWSVIWQMYSLVQWRMRAA